MCLLELITCIDVIFSYLVLQLYPSPILDKMSTGYWMLLIVILMKNRPLFFKTLVFDGVLENID